MWYVACRLVPASHLMLVCINAPFTASRLYSAANVCPCGHVAIGYSQTRAVFAPDCYAASARLDWLCQWQALPSLAHWLMPCAAPMQGYSGFLPSFAYVFLASPSTVDSLVHGHEWLVCFASGPMHHAAAQTLACLPLTISAKWMFLSVWVADNEQSALHCFEHWM